MITACYLQNNIPSFSIYQHDTLIYLLQMFTQRELKAFTSEQSAIEADLKHKQD